MNTNVKLLLLAAAIISLVSAIIGVRRWHSELRVERFRQSANRGTRCYVIGGFGKRVTGIVYVRDDLGRVYFVPDDHREGHATKAWYDTDEIYPIK